MFAGSSSRELQWAAIQHTTAGFVMDECSSFLIVSLKKERNVLEYFDIFL
jgi:hypothetical protein